MCMSWGGQHYVTFDKTTFSYPGTGTYSMVQDCKEQPSYKISINQHYICEPEGCLTAAKIHIKDLTVLLAPEGAYVNGKKVQLPHSVDCLVLTQHSSYITVTGVSELKLMYDGHSALSIFAPITMKNSVCGMCGNYNDGKNDEFRTVSGQTLSDEYAAGNHYLDSADVGKVQPITKPTSPSCSGLSSAKMLDIEKLCGVLTQSPLNACNLKVSPDHLVSLCVSDMCSCTAHDSFEKCSKIQCEVATQYSRVCVLNGITVNWRSATFCPAPTCSNGMVYMECGKSCGRTCGHESYDAECENVQCVDGCFCPDGTLFDGSKCVPANQCSCMRGQKPYAVGTSYTEKCEKCTCTTGARWTCTATECTGRCVVTGDSHYRTFDGRNYAFTGQCEYVLVQPTQAAKPDTPFSLWVENKLCQKDKSAVCAKAVTLQVGKDVHAKVIRLLLQEVYVNDVSVKLPYKHEGIIIRLINDVIHVSTNVGVNLLWRASSTLEVQLSSKLRGQVAGLCGNFNGNIDDDSLTIEGDNVKDVTQFVQSWKTSAQCVSSAAPTHSTSCSINSKYQDYAKEVCSVITQGALKSCKQSLILRCT
jgi:hypothetical protein